MLTTMRTTQAAKTATELALGIENEIERELVLHHLENTVKSTGNAEEDLRNARALANAARNQQILEEVSRRPEAKNHSSATSVTATSAEPTIVLTKDEETFLATGVITMEEIIQARQAKA